MLVDLVDGLVAGGAREAVGTTRGFVFRFRRDAATRVFVADDGEAARATVFDLDLDVAPSR